MDVIDEDPSDAGVDKYLGLHFINFNLHRYWGTSCTTSVDLDGHRLKKELPIYAQATTSSSTHYSTRKNPDIFTFIETISTPAKSQFNF